MSYTKIIACLANSRKMSGRCIAGKERLGEVFGGWVRPISKRPDGEISEYDRRYQNGDHPQVLDLIAIPMLEYRPHHYQSENHLIDDEYYWQKVGNLEWEDLQTLVDEIDELWTNGYSSYNGINDRIPEYIANQLGNSLVLIQPDTISISVGTEGAEFDNAKRRVRTLFTLRNQKYKLAITDPNTESLFLKKNDGEYNLPAKEVYLCISIGEPYNEFCYKLVASAITKPPIRDTQGNLNERI